MQKVIRSQRAIGIAASFAERYVWTELFQGL